MASIHIAEHELGFLYRQGRFDRLLEPGEHRVWLRAGVEVRRASLLEPRLAFPDAEFLVKHAEVASRVQTVRLKDSERGLLLKDGNFQALLGPGLHVLLKSPAAAFQVEVVDISGVELTHPRREQILRAPNARDFVVEHLVPDGHRGLLYHDQRPQRLLEPGRYQFWTGLVQVQVALVDVREQNLEVQGQELMSRDKVSLRLNLSARFKVADPERAVRQQADAKEALYRELQLALRNEVGARTLDELLEQKEAVGQAVLARVREPAAGLGLTLLGAGVRDVILPGEMRAILNQVIEAERRAQATMIQRREETAATRALLNTARLLEGNPVLLRLKELETVERLAEKVGSLSVHGGLDGLLEGLLQAARLGPSKG
ncbi:MAG TPA: slipin family protein [Myxococcota bacterium]|nr:slipin family protein [Myxococcota bacterium]HRY94478.1 slipin family protein [Myxococcota bacterium]HSA20074.1 slipin family protein [Myxococcota bacterium]